MTLPLPVDRHFLGEGKPSCVVFAEASDKTRASFASVAREPSSLLVAAGTYDEANAQVGLYQLSAASAADASQGMDGAAEHPGGAVDRNKQTRLRPLCRARTTSDVTAIRWLPGAANDHVVTGGADGSLAFHRISRGVLERVAHVAEAHVGPVTAVAYAEASGTVASVGEGGHVAVTTLSAAGPRSERTLRDAATLHDALVRRATTHELVTVGASASAPFKVWDLRQRDASLALTRWQKGAVQGDAHHCVAEHPTKPELFVSGSGEGHLCLWDIRKAPGALLRMERAHKGPVWGVQFVPHNPRAVVSCGEDGNVIRWPHFTPEEGSARPQLLYPVPHAPRTSVGGLAGSRMPVNALHAEARLNMLVFASDDQSLCVTSLNE